MDWTVDQHARALEERGISLLDGDVRIGEFGDSAEQSASLISLIAAGTKRGTCSLLWSWDYDGEAIPKTGDIEIVLDWNQRPALVLRTTTVKIIPFDCVTEAFAASEGEGDLSLSYWRTEHWRFFTEECFRINRSVHESMPLVCETFEVLHVLGPYG